MRDAPKNKLRAPLKPLNFQTLALTSGGLGFLRPAPGTWGSLPPVALAGVLLLAGATPTALNLTLAAVLAVSSALCVLFGRYGESRFGRKDAAEVVIDETAGQCLPLMALPGGAIHACSIAEHGPVQATLYAGGVCAGAFVLFRLADIIKPWPARSLERLPHGWGVLMDDLMAGVYAMLIMQALARVAF